MQKATEICIGQIPHPLTRCRVIFLKKSDFFLKKLLTKRRKDGII